MIHLPVVKGEAKFCCERWS